MARQETSNHTKMRPVRIPDPDWDDFGEQVGEGRRAEVIRDFIAWRLHRPGAKRPVRPRKTDSDSRAT